MTSRRNFVRAGTAVLAAAAFGRAQAQAFPSRGMTILVPFPAGGPTDQMARVLGEILAERFGQPVVVDNRPGGGGQIAGGQLIRLPADGHTLMLGEMSVLAVNAILFKKYAYDPIAEFQPITPMLSMPMMVLAPRNSPANSLQDLVALAKGKPINYASPGAGTVAHLAGELLKGAAKVDLNHIPYKGSAPAIADLLGGQVDLLIDGLGPALPHIREGKIKALAICTPTRAPVLPNLPTTTEAGYPSVQMSAAFGMVVRNGTPAATTQRLYEAIAAAIRTPRFAKRFEDLGFESMAMNPDQYRAYIKAETERQGALIKAVGISLD